MESQTTKELTLPEEPECIRIWQEYSPLAHKDILTYLNALRSTLAAALERVSELGDQADSWREAYRASQIKLAEAERDAERYRWLRTDGNEHADNEQPYVVTHLQDSYGNWRDVLIEDAVLDLAIDAARRGEEGK